jgi:hypothetical protein
MSNDGCIKISSAVQLDVNELEGALNKKPFSSGDDMVT